MDNLVAPVITVIDNATKEMPRHIREWANELRDVQSLHDWRQGRDSVGGGAGWWKSLPEPLRGYLLGRVAPDEIQSWVSARWDSMPRPLRDAIAVEARQSVRLLQGCPWR